MKSIHTNLKELRMEKGLTQEEVADRIGLTRQAISAYEAGKRQPGIDILTKLAEIYETDIEAVLYGRRDGAGKRRVMRAAILTVLVFLVLQILAGMFSTLSFVLFPMEEGPVSEDWMEIAGKHFEIGEWAEYAEIMAATSLILGSVIVLGIDLSARVSFSWKRKLYFFLAACAVSCLIAVGLGIVHPKYGIGDFMLRGPVHFRIAAILLCVDLAINFWKRRGEHK